MSRRFLPLMIAVAFAVLSRPAAAVNLYFMPGDAFFSASLSEKSVAELPTDGGTIRLTHYWLHDDMYFCGYTGFAHLDVRDASPEITSGLRTLYRTLREQGYWKEETITTRDGGDQERSEANPFLLFVYDKSFDPQRHKFGLKYNENWANPPQEAKLDRKSLGIEEIKYEKFVPGEDAIVRDWQDGPLVPGLPVKTPKGVKWASAGAGQHPPATVRAEDVRFFVLPHDELEAIYEAEANARFWEVTSTGFRRFDYESVEDDPDKTEFVITDIPFDQPERLSGE